MTRSAVLRYDMFPALHRRRNLFDLLESVFHFLRYTQRILTLHLFTRCRSQQACVCLICTYPDRRGLCRQLLSMWISHVPVMSFLILIMSTWFIRFCLLVLEPLERLLQHNSDEFIDEHNIIWNVIARTLAFKSRLAGYIVRMSAQS